MYNRFARISYTVYAIISYKRMNRVNDTFDTTLFHMTLYTYYCGQREIKDRIGRTIRHKIRSNITIGLPKIITISY